MNDVNSPADLRKYWDFKYWKCEPVPHLLRTVYPERWVRFHSLPESKRYPENEEEFLAVLDRHNTVLAELAVRDETLIFVSTGFSDSPEAARDDEDLNRLDRGAQSWLTMLDHDFGEEANLRYYSHVFMSKWTWKAGVFDEILRRVADWEIATIMILSTKNDWVFHPYDGGADFILATTEQRDRLKSKYEPWLSPRQDGM